MFASALTGQRGQQAKRQRHSGRALSGAVGQAMMECLEARQMLSVAPLIFTSKDVPKTTPVNATTGTGGIIISTPMTVSSGLIVTGVNNPIDNVTVTVNLTTYYNYYVNLTLVSPAGTKVPLLQQTNMQTYAYGSNFTNTTFDDAATATISAGTYPYMGSFQPASPLSALANENANGIWRLQVTDIYGNYPDTLTGWSISLAPTAPPPQISGIVWNDSNRNGVRDTSIVNNATGNATIIYAIDVSAGAAAPMAGTAVGDVNGDGMADTILDTELAGYIALNQDLLSRGFGNTKVAILLYADQAELYGASGLFNLNTTVSADTENNGAGNGTPDIEDALKTIQIGQDNLGTGLSYHAALQQALIGFTTLQTGTGNGTLLLSASGMPSANEDLTADVTALTTAGVSLRAFIFNSQYTTTDSYLAAIGDSNMAGVTVTELPVADRRIYLDLNNNGVWDSATEPTTLTDVAGGYDFSGLPDGTYVVRAILPAGWVQTTPALGAYSVSLSPELPTAPNMDFGAYETGQISGFAWDDRIANAARDTSLITGASADIVVAIDASADSKAVFPGAIVGDVNGDGVANTVLDVELASVIALNDDLIARGLDRSTRLTVIAYGEDASYIHLVPTLKDVDYAVRPSADIDTALHAFRLPSVLGSDLNYIPALQLAAAAFTAMKTPVGSGSLIFLSAGTATDVTPVTAAVTALQKLGVTRHAFAVGSPNTVGGLQPIDVAASNFVNSDQLVSTLGGAVDGMHVTYTEPGIGGVRVFLDENGDGIWQSDTEPSTLTDPSGNYAFADLPFGTYTVQQVAVPGWVNISPAGGMQTVTVMPGQSGLKVNFGSVLGASISGQVLDNVPADINHEAGQVPLAGVTVYLDNDHDGQLTLAHTVTNPDGTTTNVPADPSTTTDAQGVFTFSDLVPGSYDVRTVDPTGVALVGPFAGVYHTTLSRGQALSALNFVYHTPAPQIKVAGSSRNIANNSVAPSTANSTDFGNIAVGKPLTRSFTITNQGDASLLFSGRPAIRVAGGAAGDFKILNQPPTFLAPRASFTFRVTFTPHLAGVRNARITIANSDAAQNPFQFTVRGTGGPVRRRVATASRAMTQSPGRTLLTATSVFNASRGIVDDHPVW